MTNDQVIEVMNMLSMVGISVRKHTIRSWTNKQLEQANEWAGACTLRQGGVELVCVPDKPEFLP